MKRGLFQSIVGQVMLIAVLIYALLTFSVKTYAAGTVAIQSAVINGSNVIITATASAPTSDDGVLYLFAEKVWEDAISGEPIASLAVSDSVTFTVDLNANTANSYLFDKFVVATKQSGSYVAVSNAQYISNPEAMAVNTAARKNAGKKGLILEGDKLTSGEATTLGVQQASYNLFVEDITSGSGYNFTYNGKTYTFNLGGIQHYDQVFSGITNQGMGLTVTLLNRYVAGNEYMINPDARAGIGGTTPYFMFNTKDQSGAEEYEALCAFLAQRYNGQSGVGQVDNWIVGNEINAASAWNYYPATDVTTYAQVYADTLRMAYNAIVSQNANATVSFSIDQVWNRSESDLTAGTYNGKAFLDAFNTYTISQGNYDWSLAQHPYPVPLTWAKFWASGEADPIYPTLVKHAQTTPFMTIENIEQLTDYMVQSSMLNKEGAVRSILLSEVGFTSTQGEDIQAAAIVYAYQRAMNNQYIDFIIFAREQDSAAETAQGLTQGLSNADGTQKLAFSWYANMDGADSATYIEQARQIIGYSDWNAQMYPR